MGEKERESKMPFHTVKSHEDLLGIKRKVGVRERERERD
jgi:hypothetical protein